MPAQNEVSVNGGGRQYGTKLTARGAAALAACVLEGSKLQITEIAVGDGGGAFYEPMSTQTALVHEVWRGKVLDCEKSVLNPNTIDIKGVIPSDAGGFFIREMGVFDANGTLIGVCNTPDMEKTDAASGAGGKLDLIMHLIVTDADAVQVVIKSSLEPVSLEDVRDLLKDKQDRLDGLPGQVPVFNEDGRLSARDFSSSAVFPFAAEDWGPPASWAPEEEASAYDGAEGWEIVIPAERHGRKNGDFGFHVFHHLEGGFVTNTWAALGAQARYDQDAGTVVLESASPFPGKILFVS